MKNKRDGISTKRDLLSEIKRLIGANYTDEEIAKKLALKPSTLTRLKKQILDLDKSTLQQIDPFSYFSDYLTKMIYILRELRVAKIEAKKDKNHASVISAIWKKKEAYDSIIKMAQEFGLIPRTASELKLSNEISFSTMTVEEAKMEIAREVSRLKELATRKISIRPEVAQFMDPVTKANLPDNVIILPDEKVSKASGKKSR